MAYDVLEISTQDGNPVELYEFRQGSTFWRYTTAAEDLVKTGQIFTAEMIKRDAVKQTDDITAGGISLTFIKENLFAASFLGFPPEGVTTLTIWRGHFTDTVEDFVAYWKGRVLKASASSSEITISCESVFTSLNRPGLSARYERGCRHGLYSRMCGISMSSYMVTASVIGVTDHGLVASELGAYPDGTFTGGVVTHEDGTHRLITSHVGTTININRPFPTSPGATDVLVYPGCDKLKSTCITKFNNLENFGGFPYIPYVNPFGGRSVV